MDVVYLLLYIAAAFCFAVAAFSKTSTKVALVPLGLLFWVAVPLIETVRSIN